MSAAAILRNCHAAMADGGTLFVVERVLPERADRSKRPGQEPAFADLNMLVLAGGRERTEAQFRALLEAAGFTLTRIISTPPSWQHSILEAQRHGPRQGPAA